jgi:hypothetical protein
MAVAAVAALVGTSMALRRAKASRAGRKTLILSKVSSGPARFEPKQIADFSAQMVHTLEPADVAGTMTSTSAFPTEVQERLLAGRAQELRDAAGRQRWWDRLNAQRP